MHPAKKKILYFIKGPTPTKEQLKKAETLEGRVCFRNSLLVDSSCSLEDFDQVVGFVPAPYKIKATAQGKDEPTIPKVPGK